jgi:mediator of RNA polymerase II transcription subunit 21
MADILTQIQDELDMLLNQMSLGLRYMRFHAPPGTIPGQPQLSSLSEYNAQQAALQAPPNPSQPSQPTQSSGDPSQPQSAAQDKTPGPVSPEQFEADIRELSRDLVVKEQQLEVLIDNLPGIGSSEKEQVARMAELERQLEEIEGERVAAVREKEELVRRVEAGIMGVRGV